MKMDAIQDWAMKLMKLVYRVAGSLIIHLGDVAGVEKISVRSSTNAEVFAINSLGVISIGGTATLATIRWENTAGDENLVIASPSPSINPQYITLKTGGASIQQNAVSAGFGASALSAAFSIIGGAHTGITGGSEIVDVIWSLDRVVTHEVGNIPYQRSVVIYAPTYAFAGASTIDVAASVYIDSAPIAGANATITNSFALWIGSGKSHFGGDVATAGQIQSVLATGTAPLAVASTTLNTNLNADMVDNAHASATPTASTIPIANASGKLDTWVTANPIGASPSVTAGKTVNNGVAATFMRSDATPVIGDSDMVDGLHAATSGANAHVLATDANGNAAIDGFVTVGGKKFGMGVAFPAVKATGDIFLRTDLSWMCFYDGTRWLTCQEFSASFGHQIANVATQASATGVFANAILRSDYAPYFTYIAIESGVLTTNNSTNYWTIQVETRDSAYTAGTRVALRTFNTSADAVNTWISHSGTPSTPNPAVYVWLILYVNTKTGAPGNWIGTATAYYRLIVT